MSRPVLISAELIEVDNPNREGTHMVPDIGALRRHLHRTGGGTYSGSWTPSLETHSLTMTHH